MAIRRANLSRKTVSDPLRLAALYEAGLGTHWNNQQEASERMRTSYNINTSACGISQAINVSELPEEILQLFKDVSLLNRTARQLISAKRTQGIDQLVERAKAIDPSGKTRLQLVALLCGEAPPRRRIADLTLLQLAEKHKEGVTAGAWSTLQDGAQALRVAKNRLVIATNVAKLPQEVLDLFPSESLTLSLGRRLLAISKARGVKAIRRIAIQAKIAVPRLSPEELLKRFVGVKSDKVEVKLSQKGGKLVLEYHCDPDDPETETRLAMIANWLNAA